MKADERVSLAKKGTDLICSLFRDGAGDVGLPYRESVAAKLELLVIAADEAVRKAGKPVVFEDVIPGFVAVALRAQGAAPLPSEVRPLDARAISSANETCLILLSHALKGLQIKDARTNAGTRGGAYIFLSADETHYFLMRKECAQETLNSIGIIPEAMINGFDAIGAGGMS